MKFIRTVFTKIKDYFTTNIGRKIFFFGLIATALCFIVYRILDVQFFYIAAIFALAVAGIGTLWDSMYSRYLFLKKIREIQYTHLKEIADKQEAGESVAITPTFTDDEKRYLRRRKWTFVMMILFKVGLVIALFSLLLSI